jgi:hypothetical protein
MIAASTSLPEPFGPVINTGTSAAAICVAFVTTSRIGSLSNTSPHRSNFCASAARESARRRAARSCSTDNRRSSSRLRIVVNNRASSQGFAT